MNLNYNINYVSLLSAASNQYSTPATYIALHKVLENWRISPSPETKCRGVWCIACYRFRLSSRSQYKSTYLIQYPLFSIYKFHLHCLFVLLTFPPKTFLFQKAVRFTHLSKACLFSTLQITESLWKRFFVYLRFLLLRSSFQICSFVSDSLYLLFSLYITTS
jgi:hypothetical protein